MSILALPQDISNDLSATGTNRGTASTNARLKPSERTNWHKRLIEGLEQNQFQLYRQRIVSIQPDVKLPGDHFEVLLRLHSKHRGPLSPAAFMPAARRLRLLQEIDRWVIQGIFEHAGVERNNGLPPVNYAINLSGAAIGDPDLLIYILEQMEATDVDPQHICFEFTETVAVRHLRRAQHLISVLKERGCRFALDDFGQGLSSLTHLKHLSVDYLKIDGSFVKNLASDRIDFAIVEAIHRMAQAIGLKTIAEYAETDAIIDNLRKIGVDFAQGYRIHKPEPFRADSNELQA